ncbi:hypothetical protein ACMU9U_004068 [Yersinia enterocolitica]
MKKIILTCTFLFSFSLHAGPYADIAKAKFESEMVQAIQLTDMSDTEKTKAISRLPMAQKTLREVARDGIRDKKSCLKIKKDFVSNQKKIMSAEDIFDKDFASTSLNAMGDYIATVCLDIK